MQRGMGSGLGMGRGMGGGQGMGMGGGRGMGRGMGGGMGGGMGRGMGRGMAAGTPGVFQPAPPANPNIQQPATTPMSREQELAMLKDQARTMEAQLNEINAHIQDMEKVRKNLDLIAYIEAEKCNGCSRCLPACPTAAIALVDTIAQVDKAKCTGCGQCVIECQNNAISLKKV